MRHRAAFGALAGLALTAACGSGSAPPPASPGVAEETPTAPGYDAFAREDFNRLALRLDLPLYWQEDRDADGAVDPDEVRGLLFHSRRRAWVADGAFTPAFEEAWAAMVAASEASPPEDERRRLVLAELAHTAPTLVYSDLRSLPAAHRAFARRMLRVATLVDDLYAKQTGMASMRPADDLASRALFRRNWGVRCKGARTESEPACSAAEGAPAQPVGVYPAALQQVDGFCEELASAPAAEALLDPFTVVRETNDGPPVAVPYPQAWPAETGAIAAELEAAASVMTDADEAALVTYLRAAAQAFRDNDWEPADEAWAAMNATNSRWYVRVGPDEVYWDPCSRKAAFHLTLALLDPASLAWQERLTPLRQAMEERLSQLAGPAYRAREVAFSLPDFIRIVVNAGDDRDPFGATIGQSLPNWGRVTEEGRGRTVAMSNLYTDADSQGKRLEVGRTLVDAASLEPFSADAESSLLATILHEATHNLGPAHEYRHRGKTAAEAFGGGMASMLEELKAQTGALFYVGMLGEEGLLDEGQRREAYLDSFLWALGHVSRGMYTPSGQRKAYSQLAAIQVGFLLDRGALRWDPEAAAANGEDVGAFHVDYDAFPGAIRELMKAVLEIKGRNDVERAAALAARYVDGDVVPQDVVAERHRRFPQTTFVYAVDLGEGP